MSMLSVHRFFLPGIFIIGIISLVTVNLIVSASLVGHKSGYIIELKSGQDTFLDKNLNKGDDPVDVSGLWIQVETDPDDEFQIVFEIKRDSDNNYSGNSHILYHDFKYTTDTLLEIRFIGKLLSMISHPGEGQLYEGELSPDGSFIHGKLVNKDGSGFEHNMKRLDPDTISWIDPLPGFENTTGSYVYSPPRNLDDGIMVSNLGEVSIERNMIDTLINKVLNKEVGEVHSILIAKHNKLVFEEYFYGHNENSLQACHSTTKSISSLIFGMSKAIMSNKVLDQSIWDYFPEYMHLKKAGNADITIRDLLTMTAGFDPVDHNWDENKDMYANILSRNMSQVPGKIFQYDGACSNLLGKIIFETTGQQADELAEQKLFHPLGITRYHWIKDMKDGLPLIDGGLVLRSRDMLKIGLLVCNNGKWDDKQIIPEAWITESTKSHITQTNWGEEEYGYLWWLEKPGSFNNVEPVIYAQGMGFQLIMIVPESNLVIVVTAGNYQGMEKNFKLWEAIHTIIL